MDMRVHDPGQRIQTGAMRERRAVQHRIAGCNGIDVGKISLGHEAQVTVR